MLDSKSDEKGSSFSSQEAGLDIDNEARPIEEDNA
jgi:hypothetical protein